MTTTLHCIRCGKSQEFDHVVVRLADREELGSICVACADQTAELFEDASGDGDGTCDLCPRQSSYAFPVWDVVAVDEDTDEIRWLEYDVTRTTIHLCGDHLEALNVKSWLVEEHTDHRPTPVPE